MKNIKPTFIGGLGEKPSDYKSLSKHLRVVSVDWNTGKTTPKIGKVDTLIGFSMGGFVAYLHAQKNRVKHLVLCSLSPLENLDGIKAERLTFLIGEKERFLHDNVKRIAKTIEVPYSIVIVPKSGHKIDKNYQKVLLEILQKRV